MKELKFKKEEELKFVEDTLNTDFIGLETLKDGKVIILKGYHNEYCGISKKCQSTNDKWFRSSKLNYIEDYSPKPTKVILFDNEVEMILWYNDNN